MSFKPTIIDAIVSLKADAKVIIKDEDYDTIVWEDGNPTSITKTQIETKLSELTTAYDDKAYARKRAVEYPSIQEQLDMQYWDGVNSTTTWSDAIAKVKSENPK